MYTKKTKISQLYNYRIKDIGIITEYVITHCMLSYIYNVNDICGLHLR